MRNPLSAAISACTFVSSAIEGEKPLSTNDSKAAVQEDVGVIKSSLQYVNDLLRNMLDMHKASSGQLEVHLSPLCVKEDVFDPVITMLHQREHAFEVEVDCPSSLAIISDRIRLKQIVLNLTNNSCKFVQRGYIRIGARVLTEDGLVQIFVEDSGPGLAEEKRDQLFDKFQTSLDNLNQGTGFGLSLCKELVSILGGTIFLDNDWHSGIDGCPGARFVVELKAEPVDTAIAPSKNPVNDEKNDKNPDMVSSTPGDSTVSVEELPLEYRILFVDDDMILRRLFTRSVKRVAPSWTVQESANGETAIRLVTEEGKDFDLIFIDQYMAGVERQLLGTETARALRSKGFQGIICGLSANEMEEPFLASGADAFSLKPFPCEKEMLKIELRRIIRNGGGGDGPKGQSSSGLHSAPAPAAA